jgi:glycosyltransferase involved in cell wall biosynthesis
MPARNCDRFLAAAMQSVLAQTWPAVELFVVDDASTDKTLAVAESCADARTTILRGNGQGAAAARNIGLAQARGAFIKFLDADDLINPVMIASQVQLLSSKGQDYVAGSTWYRFTGAAPDHATLKSEPPWEDLDPVSWLVASFTSDRMMLPGCWLVPAAVIARAGNWDATHVRSQNDDTEYFTRVLLASRGVVIAHDAELYYRSDVPSSLSQDQSEAARQARLHDYFQIKKALLAHEDSPRTRDATARNFARFVYEIWPRYPALTAQAMAEIDAFTGNKASLFPAGRLRRLSRVAGYRQMLRLRELIRKFSGTYSK